MNNNTSGDVLKKDESTLEKTLVGAASHAKKEALKSEISQSNSVGLKSCLSDAQVSIVKTITAKTDLLYNEFNEAITGYSSVW